MSWLSNRLAQLLTERQLAVEHVARQLGIERSRLSNIVSGAAVPNENLTRRLARYFGEDPEAWLANATGSREAVAAADLPSDFVKVAAAAEIADGEMKIVCENRVVVANAGGRFHAFGNICPHAAGPIGEGFLDGTIVECPWHAGQWDIVTGKALTPIATADIPVFEVRVTSGDVQIRLSRAGLTQGSREDLP